ncbi:MAG TPA: glycosyltransferase [Pirellulaceae bacterium]|nr:glycosyltransferase [Pirellulaceae bacterium]
MLLPETLKAHDRERFEFHYLYFLPWKNQMVEAIEQAGGRVTCLPAKNNLALLRQAKRIAHYCRDHQIDLIHAHLPWAGFVARRVHRLTRILTLYTEHNLQSRYHWATRWINRLTFNHQSLALAVSDDVKDSIAEYVRPRIEVRTVLNGVNTDSFVRTCSAAAAPVRTQLNISPESLVIGTVAVFRFQKRLDVWLEVFQKIQQRCPEARGIIVGAGPLESDIRQHCNLLGLDNSVHFPGLQTDVRPYFEAMDVFMMTSSFEGLPIALLEAMSMQCAIVATAAGGIKQVLRDGIDGEATPVESPEALVDRVLALSKDPDRMAMRKQAARQRVVDNYSIRRMVHELEEIYKQWAS